ncbi:uncharacterized protein LOC133034483 [Cannabis sativa]|uniref:uncharacterized protein LOC133034483 n=1 Tax=Cannabis sativa TaxID=3483 RepID=UPI0029C9DCB4|nr:uncharacterized protein LOC133034483 [Cannabis sativa]
MFQGWCFTANNAWHKGGRIIVAWNSHKFTVNIISCSSQLVHLFVTMVDKGGSFFVSFVYGFNNANGRSVLWEELQRCNTVEPWLILGDFNEILSKEERIGDKARFIALDFQSCINICQLEDVKFSGSFFTWSNKQQGSDCIFSKIDRVLANQAWLDRFKNAEAVFLCEGIFDHTPVVLSIYPDTLGGKKPFKYFRMWKQHPQYDQRIKEIWQQEKKGTRMFQVVTKLKELKSVFKEINKEGFNEIHIAEKQARDRLTEAQKALQADPLNFELQEMELATRNEQRRMQNNIISIEKADGERVDDSIAVTDVFLQHYTSFLNAKMETRKRVQMKVIRQGPVLSNQHISLLEAEFSKEEVKAAIFSIPGTKAPGPDGYSSFFFQDNWDLVGNDIPEAVTSFLHSGKLLKEINSTVLTLIPKVRCPNTVSDYRPIACCNVLYKIATKLICSRLKLILSDIVSQNQGGFVTVRYIAHNIMICQDLIRHYGRKSTRPNCMIKLDLQKAYDTLDWDFLEEMLNALNFPS